MSKRAPPALRAGSPGTGRDQDVGDHGVGQQRRRFLACALTPMTPPYGPLISEKFQKAALGQSVGQAEGVFREARRVHHYPQNLEVSEVQPIL